MMWCISADLLIRWCMMMYDDDDDDDDDDEYDA